MVGLLDDHENKMTLDFKEKGDIIYLLGESKNDVGCSEYAHKICGVEFSPAPYFDLEEEFRLHETVSLLINKKIIQSAHDVSEGGLFVTLAECAFNRSLGFEVATSSKIRKDAYWFGEAQGRVVVSINESNKEEFEKLLTISFEKIGMVTSGNVNVQNEPFENIAYWAEKYDNAIGNYFKSYLPE